MTRFSSGRERRPGAALFFRLLGTLVLLAAGASGTGRAEEAVRDHPVSQVGCHSYVIYGSLGRPSPENQGFVGNTGFVVTGAGVVVIDPGPSVQAGRMVLRQIASITDQPVTHVINSHAHGEHWLGNQAIAEAFPDVLILAHHRMLRSVNWLQAQDWIDYLARMTAGFTVGTRFVPPEHPVQGTLVMEQGGVTLHIHALEQGREETSVVVEVLEDSVAYVGEEFEIGPEEEVGGTPLCVVSIPVLADLYVPDHGPAGPVGLVDCPQGRDAL